MLKIRLTRMGKKHQPAYRIVVTPKENPVQGQYIDLVGTYNPLKSELNVDAAKATEWLNKGAQPSERVARLLAKSGVQHKSIVVKVYAPKPVEAPAAEEVAETPAETTDEAPEAEVAEETEAPAEEAATETAEETAPEATPAE